MHRSSPELIRVGILALGVLFTLFLTAANARAQTVLFATGFEESEGYRTDADLSGQNGWIGSGADGLLADFWGDGDQQAYIGFTSPPGATNDFHYVYHPLSVDPGVANQSVIKFSVTMQIVDSSSTNGPWDDFRWSVYNTNGTRLFSIDFDNDSRLISYLLDDGAFVSTERGFDNLGFYDLVISMNFGRNLWSATLNDEVIVNAKLITAVGSPLNLGDIDAIWSIRDPRAPGDNYMVFDDYRVTVEAAQSLPPRFESTGRGADGSYRARLYGEPGLVYRIETSGDLVQWQPLLTLTAPIGGVIDFQDPAAATLSTRFYRARQQP